MKGIAYFVDGHPRLTWPGEVAVLNEDGFPTGEMTSNLEELIADLPEGTDYILVTEEEAEAWWVENQPEPTIFERIAEAQAPFIEQQALAKKEYQTADIEGDEEWKAEAQAEYQASIVAMKEAIEQARGGE